MGSPRETSRSDVNVLALIDHLSLGGAEMLLGKFAAAAPRAGIRLSVAHLLDRGDSPAAIPLRAAGVEPVSMHLTGRPGLEALRRVRRHIKAVNPDLVHTHMGAADLVGSVTSRSLRVPMVSTIHTAIWDEDVKTSLIRMVVRAGAARVIAVSDEAKRVYASHHWSSRGQLVRIYNGVDVEPKPGAGLDVRREFGWDESHLVVGMVSAFRTEKGHDVAISAVGRLLERFPYLRLLIVGDGRELHAVREWAAKLGGHVALAGERNDVMRCMDAFDVCLHPSRIDAFPTTLIEAMAASVPVLATAVGGIPEIIDDGVNGLLVAPPPEPEKFARALTTLLDDVESRRRLGVAGRKTYETRFTADPWIEETRALYDKVLGERGPRTRRAVS